MRNRVRSRPWATAGLVLVLAAGACSGGDGDDGATSSTTERSPSTATTEAPDAGVLEDLALEVEEVAVLDSPIALAERPGTDDLYVAEKAGRIVVLEASVNERTGAVRYRVRPTPVLDISDEVAAEGEQGLLGLAFSSNGGKLYVDYTAAPDGRTVVAEYAVGSSIDKSSRRILLEVDQPYANHNGGHLAAGRDGYLYVGLGDGGDAGDPDGRGQDPHDLLGSILRIDPEGGSAEGPAYAIPAGNPFADGEAGAPEVWLYGVRNPWRFSFDRTTGDLWVADVGQGDWEEIDLLPADGGFDAGRGANLGWDRMEGSHRFEGDNPPDAVLPVHEYSHDDGCSITGGFVYRGAAVEALVGTYLFTDFCEPGLRAIQVENGAVTAQRTWGDLLPAGAQSFGEDGNGELFVLLADGPVLKIVAAEAGPGTDRDDLDDEEEEG